eukprot:TRINITY_DN107_c0_g1_i1.p1 TRINITY_DN107_c0_g1~~TRINITY_DN107_c0_g1_i1.p1  ORF type:complete len:323 (+),score=33.50 TRINITY_DN107_c0_g1_i1:192-1160(+)
MKKGGRNQRRCMLSSLPDSVLLTILNYLEPTSLVPFLLVSHKFRALSSSPFLWRKVLGGFHGYFQQHYDCKRFHNQKRPITLKVLVLGGLECKGRVELMSSIRGLHNAVSLSGYSVSSLLMLSIPRPHVYSPIYVCLNDTTIVRLLLYEVSDPSMIPTYGGYHFGIVMYDTCNIFSLIEEAKHLVKELDRSSTPVKNVLNSHNRLHLPVFLSGCKGSESEYHCDLKRAQTLVPLFKSIQFCGCNELNVNSYESVLQTLQSSVTTCLQLMGWVNFQKQVESVQFSSDYYSITISEDNTKTDHFMSQAQPIEEHHESAAKCTIQ